MLPSDEAKAGKCRQMQSWPVILEMLTLKNSLENVSITGLYMDTSHGGSWFDICFDGKQ
jgi:hypothetical protein